MATAPTPNSGRFAVVSIAGMHDVDIEVGDAMNLNFPGGIRAPGVVQLSAVIADSALTAAAETDG